MSILSRCANRASGLVSGFKRLEDSALLTHLPDTLLRHRMIVGLLALLICAATWALDLTQLVYECPFCRAQRTVIGLLGLILLLPWHRHPSTW